MVEQPPVRDASSPWPAFVAAVAAFAVGTVFVSVLPDLVLPTGLRDLSPGLPLRVEVFGPAAVALAVTAPLALRRATGWLVALVGLLAVVVTHQLVEEPLLVSPSSGLARYGLPFLVEVTGVGLALGGVALAIGQAARPVRLPATVGLAAGLAAQPLAVVVVRAVAPPIVTPVEAQLWLALAATLAAGLLGLRRPSEPTGQPVGSLRWTPVVAVAVTALVVVAGMVLRWWALRELTSPGGGPAGRAGDSVDTLVRHSAVALAVVTGLGLLGYASRALGVLGARWATVGVAAAAATLVAPLSLLRVSTWQLSLVAVVGLLAVAAGATLARYAAWAFPWDALGVVVAAVGLLPAAPAVRAYVPSAAAVGAVVVVLGLGLALGFGLTFLATRIPAAWHAPGGPADADRGWHGAAVASGLATWVLTAQALSPVGVRVQARHLWLESSIVLPVVTGAAGAMLVVLFVVGHRVRRFGDVPSAGTVVPPGPTR